MPAWPAPRVSAGSRTSDCSIGGRPESTRTSSATTRCTQKSEGRRARARLGDPWSPAVSAGQALEAPASGPAPDGALLGGGPGLVDERRPRIRAAVPDDDVDDVDVGGALVAARAEVVRHG